MVISLTNGPGALSHLCTIFSKAGVNITGIFAPPSKGSGEVRAMVDNLERAKAALKEAKVGFSEEEVIVVELDNRPGAFADVAAKLARSNISMEYAYATTSLLYARLVAAVPDVTKALLALGEANAQSFNKSF